MHLTRLIILFAILTLTTSAEEETEIDNPPESPDLPDIWAGHIEFGHPRDCSCARAVSCSNACLSVSEWQYGGTDDCLMHCIWPANCDISAETAGWLECVVHGSVEGLEDEKPGAGEQEDEVVDVVEGNGYVEGDIDLGNVEGPVNDGGTETAGAKNNTEEDSNASPLVKRCEKSEYLDCSKTCNEGLETLSDAICFLRCAAGSHCLRG